MPVAPKHSRAVFRKLGQDLAKLSSEPEARNVHRLRTGTRRLQILLDDLSPKLGRNEEKLLKALGRIRKRAGKARDLHVQLTALRSLKIPQEPRRKTQLMNQLIELRGRQEKKLRKVLTKAEVRDIQKRLKRASKDFNPDLGKNPLAVARGILERIQGQDGPATESVLHQYRIATKRARYAAEFAGQSSEARQFVSGLKRVQDALGDWHDWLTLSQTANQQLGDVRESSLVAELHNVTGAKFRHAVAVLSQLRGARAAAKPMASGRAPAASASPSASAQPSAA